MTRVSHERESRSMIDKDVIGDLVDRCVLRDQRAFAELYRRTSAKLYGVALRIVRRRDWAEDVLQEGFLNIWNHAHSYTHTRSAPMTWMISVVRNRALDWLRRPRFEDNEADYDALLEALPDQAADPERLLDRSRDSRALHECLAQLPARQQQCIVLAYVYGMSHSELAQHMNEPIGTVKTSIRRGLERLKVRWEVKAAAIPPRKQAQRVLTLWLDDQQITHGWVRVARGGMHPIGSLVRTS
jgi:RNA polymerase sigma-70 factor, ECF subfamily